MARHLKTIRISDNNAPQNLHFLIHLSGVKEVKEVKEVKDNTWYTLDGRKLDEKPTKKGLYIHEGRKVVIK